MTIDNEKMRLYDITIAEIAAKLAQENIQVPAGQLSEGNTIYSLRTIGEFKNIDQIRNTIITVREGQALLLKDIALVNDGIAQPIYRCLFEKLYDKFLTFSLAPLKFSCVSSALSLTLL